MDSIQDGRHARAASNAGAAVPYFCQWESAHLAGAIIRGELDLKDDPPGPVPARPTSTSTRAGPAMSAAWPA